MGEYYNWINVDKREYICPADFGYGNKFHESIHKDSIPLCALHTLLNDEWKGDHVLWFGDECSVFDSPSCNIIQTLYAQSVEFGYPGDAFDMICETYKNVSGLFKEAEENVREEINYYLEDFKTCGKLDCFNEYGVDLTNPFEGLFVKRGRRYKYTINHTKKVYYSLDETAVLYPDHTRSDFLDPILILMGYGRVTDPGEWIGDIIGASDQRPKEYELLTELRICN